MIEVGFIYGAGKGKVEERIKVHLVIIWFDGVCLMTIGCQKVQQTRGPVGNDCTQHKFKGRQVNGLRLQLVSILVMLSPNVVVCSCLLWFCAFFSTEESTLHIYCFTLPPLEQRNQASLCYGCRLPFANLLVITAYCNLKTPSGVSMELCSKPLNVGVAEKLVNDSTVRTQARIHSKFLFITA